MTTTRQVKRVKEYLEEAKKFIIENDPDIKNLKDANVVWVIVALMLQHEYHARIKYEK